MYIQLTKKLNVDIFISRISTKDYGIFFLPGSLGYNCLVLIALRDISLRLFMNVRSVDF